MKIGSAPLLALVAVVSDAEFAGLDASTSEGCLI
jgi:hypothetical protein